MKAALTLAALLALTACKKSPQDGPVAVPTREVVAGVEMIDFTSEEAKFAARVPGEWKVRPDKYLKATQGLSMFNGDKVHISILKFPETDPYTDARKYAETFWMLTTHGPNPVITEEKIGDHAVLRFHQERPYYKPHSKKVEYMNRFDYALFPIEGGFFRIEHSAPVDSYQKTYPVFEAILRSFKPAI